MRVVLLLSAGISFGLLASAGVFTVLAAVGLIPRFAGKTHTARRIFLYENMVVLGTVAGGAASVFPNVFRAGAWLERLLPQQTALREILGSLLQGVFGLFGGMFVGCLALAIAEMLDSIPIFARRISFRRGIGLAVLCMAAGKLCGALLYFLTGMERTIS